MKRIALAFVCFVVALISPAQPLGTIVWRYDSANGTSSPALALDGTVYISGTGGLLAVTNSGGTASNKWTFPAQGQPVVAADGTIYLVDGNLIAINPDGSQKWLYSATGGSGCSGIAYDGTIYFVAQGRLYAIHPSGLKKWEILLQPDSSFWSNVQSPVIGADGTIYVGISDTLYAVKPNGTSQWDTELRFYGIQSPALGADGTIYGVAGGLYAFDPKGTNLWYLDLSNDRIGGSPVVNRSGTILVSTYSYADPLRGRSLYAVTTVGGLVWQALGSPMYGQYTSAAVDSGGIAYYCVSNRIWALSPDGEIQWNISSDEVPPPAADLATSSPIIGPDGILYAALGKTLYAIATGTNGPAASPWPMYRQNARHTGKIEQPALKQPQKRSDSNFQFQLYAQVDQTQSIQTSTDLVNWAALTGIVITNVPIDVIDLTASNFPARFYRTQSE